MSPISILFTIIKTIFRDSRNNIAGPEDGACSRKRCYSCACEQRSLCSSRLSGFFSSSLSRRRRSPDVTSRSVATYRRRRSPSKCGRRKFQSCTPSNCVTVNGLLRPSRRRFLSRCAPRIALTRSAGIICIATDEPGFREFRHVCAPSCGQTDGFLACVRA